MDTESDKKTSAVGSNTNRRGGVRTRGGRLPPIMVRPVEPVKKSFAPNIPQRRARPKDVESEIKREEDDHKTRISSRDGSKGRGSRRGRREYIQTEGGVFAGGLGPVARRPTSNVDRPKIYKPIFNRSKKKTAKEIDDMNKGLDGELEECDGSSSNGEEDSFANEIVRLPLRKSSNDAAAIKKEVKTELRQEQQETPNKTGKETEDTKSETVKTESEEIDQVTEEVAKIMSGGVVVKTEPIDDYPTSVDNSTVEPKVEIKKEDAGKNDIKPSVMVSESEILSKHDDDQLLFIQFPTRMPFVQFVDEEPKPGPSTPLAEPKPDIAGTQLNDMVEGLIGKMQFMKSGDVRLCLGEATMGLHCENRLSCFLQAVTVESHVEDDEEVDIAVIGNIEKSLLCYPVAEDCLDKIERAKNALINQ